MDSLTYIKRPGSLAGFCNNFSQYLQCNYLSLRWKSEGPVLTRVSVTSLNKVVFRLLATRATVKVVKALRRCKPLQALVIVNKMIPVVVFCLSAFVIIPGICTNLTSSSMSCVVQLPFGI